MLQLEAVGRKPGIRSVHQVHVGAGLDAVQGQGRRVLVLPFRGGDDRGDDGDARRRERRRRARIVSAHRRTTLTIPRPVVHDRHRRSLAAPTNCEPPFRSTLISRRYECSTGSRAASSRPGVRRTDRPTASDSARFRHDTDVEPSSPRRCTQRGRLKRKRDAIGLIERLSLFLDFSEISRGGGEAASRPRHIYFTILFAKLGTDFSPRKHSRNFCIVTIFLDQIRVVRDFATSSSVRIPWPLNFREI